MKRCLDLKDSHTRNSGPLRPGCATSLQMLLKWRHLCYIRSSPAPTEANKCQKPRSHNRRVLPWEHVVITSTQISYQYSSLLLAQKRSHTLTWFRRSGKTWGKWEMRVRDSASQQPSVTMTAQKETYPCAVDPGNCRSNDGGAL